MPESKPATCSKCSGNIAPGTLFCWRHSASPPKVGEIVAEHGQLVWRTTAACAGSQERPIAVLLDGAQVGVREANEASSARPARVQLEVGDPATQSSAVTAVEVSLAELLDVLLGAGELIEARKQQ